ncbi:MAG: serine/threonine-protein kinase, partial [Planctomycetaceae bacterium]
MTAAAPTDLDPSPRCRQALHEIDRLIDAGLPVDRAALLLQYADVADELRVHFELADQLRGLSELIPAPCSPAAPTVPEAIASFGDYEVLERIGGGGMGVVFKARQRSLNRLVALKFPAGGALAGAEAVERFRQEAQTLAQLHHPHIVGVYEVGVHEGRTYFSMEYVDGANLETLLRENPPPPEQAVEWARVIAAAIDYAHRQGIVHRDLKPANILIDVAGTVRIADFGLGKLLASDHSLTQTGQILGTLRYMAPEQADGTADPSPEAADIYSIGAILYELVSGRPAFWASSAVGLIRQIHEQEPLPLRQLDSRVPKDLETICLKCLSKSPADRYLAAGELADDLRRYLNGEPVVARPVSRSERLWRWCRRRPLVAGLSAATLMTIVAAAVVSTYFGWVAIQERQAAIDAKAVAEQNAQAAAQQEQLAKAELARSEGLLYAGQIARAQRAWDDADLPAAWEALSACKP